MRVMDPSQQDSHTVVRMDSPHGPQGGGMLITQYNTIQGTTTFSAFTSTVIRASAGCIMSWRKGAEYHLYGHDV